MNSTCVLGARHLTLLGESSVPKRAKMGRSHSVTPTTKEIIVRTAGGEKALRLSRCFWTKISSHLTILIDSSPEIMAFAIDGDIHY